MGDDAVLEVGFSTRRQLVWVVTLLPVLALALLNWLASGSSWWALLIAAELAVIVPWLTVLAVRMGRAGPVLRLDHDGLTIRGAPLVPWSDLLETRTAPLWPWPRLGRWNEVLVFTPRPGVDLPGPPHHRGRPQQWGAGLRRRVYGSNLLLLPWGMTASAAEITAFAHEHGGLPPGGPASRGWLAFAVFFLATIALSSLAIVVVVRLF